MSRLPAVLALAGGKSRRQRVWDEIRRHSENAGDDRSFSAREIAACSRVEMSVVREYLHGLEAAGYLCAEPGSDERPQRGVKKRLVLAKNNGVEAPRVRRDGSPVTQGRGSQAMWDAITALDTFTPAFLAELAQVKLSTAKTYCSFLHRAGYLDVVTPVRGAVPAGAPFVYFCALAQRTKPLAPMVTRLKAVYDPNVHSIVWTAGADDAADQIERGEVDE